MREEPDGRKIAERHTTAERATAERGPNGGGDRRTSSKGQNAAAAGKTAHRAPEGTKETREHTGRPGSITGK